MRVLILSIVLIVLSSNLIAQADNVAPVLWERYKISSKKISFILPKMPTVMAYSDPCTQIEKATYRAYADGAAYAVTITSRLKGERPSYCPRLVPYEDDARDFDRLVDRVQHDGTFSGRTATTIGGINGFRFSSERSATVLLSDIAANQRLIELEVIHYPDNPPDIGRFVTSLQLDDANGKEIGEGSLVTLGDEGTPVVAQLALAPVETEKPRAASVNAHSGSGAGNGSGSGAGSGASLSTKDVKPYMLAAREKARYTDAARRENVQGTVRLKVTLLANGAVGSVSVVQALPHGLTENAVYAAKRLVFLPKRVDGKPVSVIVTVEYSFSLY